MEKRIAKIGSMPRDVIWILGRVPKDGRKVGDKVTFRRNNNRWAPKEKARIWQIGPPSESILFLEL